jgi:hypothetical protein
LERGGWGGDVKAITRTASAVKKEERRAELKLMDGRGRQFTLFLFELISNSLLSRSFFFEVFLIFQVSGIFLSDFLFV